MIVVTNFQISIQLAKLKGQKRCCHYQVWDRGIKDHAPIFEGINFLFKECCPIESHKAIFSLFEWLEGSDPSFLAWSQEDRPTKYKKYLEESIAIADIANSLYHLSSLDYLHWAEWEDGLPVYLQREVSGDLRIHYGDVGYIQDHRGEFSAGFLFPAVGRSEVYQLAKHLFKEVKCQQDS